MRPLHTSAIRQIVDFVKLSYCCFTLEKCLEIGYFSNCLTALYILDGEKNMRLMLRSSGIITLLYFSDIV